MFLSAVVFCFFLRVRPPPGATRTYTPFPYTTPFRSGGISGNEANLVLAEKVTRTEPDPNSGIERHVDLGFVDEPVAVDPTILVNLTKDNFIPIVAPVALGADGATYNINADTMAGAIAGALGAKRF